MVFTYVDPREREDIRAHQGEETWVALNRVKPEKRDAFEHFIHDIFMPALAHVHPDVYNRTRILLPARKNKEGDYTYIFLMDPAETDCYYTIEGLLREYYGYEKADEFLKIWEDSLASPQVKYDTIQSEW